MKYSVLSNLARIYKTRLNISEVALVASIVMSEQLSRENVLKDRINFSLKDDFNYCLTESSNFYRISETLAAEIIEECYKSQVDEFYLKLKEMQIDASSSDENDVSVIDCLSKMFRGEFRYNSESRFIKSVSEWIADNKENITNKVAYTPYNSFISAEQYLASECSEIKSKSIDYVSSLCKPLILALENSKLEVEVISIEDSLKCDRNCLSSDKTEIYSFGFSCPPFIDLIDVKRKFYELVVDDMREKVKGRFAVLVPIGYTFSNNPRIIKHHKEILSEGRLKAVVKLPSGFLMDTRINIVAMLFDEDGVYNSNILFSDLSMEDCIDKASSSRFQVKINEAVISDFKDALNGITKSQHTNLISVEEIIKNDYSFDPGRYVISVEDKELFDTIALNDVPLSSVADIIRSQSYKSNSVDEGKQFFEIGAANINEVGFIEPSEKIVYLSESNPGRKYVLKKGDIVLSIKGIAGKVGFMTEDRDDLIINQSFVIIRLKDLTWSPEFLFRQLRSEAIQRLLTANSAGTIIKIIQIKVVRELLLRKPSDELLSDAREKVLEQIEIIAKIKDLKMRLNELNKF